MVGHLVNSLILSLQVMKLQYVGAHQQAALVTHTLANYPKRCGRGYASTVGIRGANASQPLHHQLC